MGDATSNRHASIAYSARSDIGMRRTNNQDSYIALPAEDDHAWLSRGHLFVVADGMGAHAAGELASKLAADGVVHHYRKLRQLSPPEAILKAFRDTNGEIHRRGQANSEFRNMGTTCSALLLLPQGALAAHVGDSRVYRVRGGRLEQLTFDHSLVWEMRAASSGLGADTSTFNIPKNVITRSLGPQANVQVDLEGPFEVMPGDRYLLCSDGLTGRVEDPEIGVIVSLLPPDEATQLLVDLANLRGGPDNITVIVVEADAQLADSRTWRGEPLMVGQELRPPATVPVAVWMCLALGLVVAAGMAILNLFIPALIVLGCAALAALIAWWPTRPTGDGISLTHGRRLGRGPYVRCDLEPLGEQIAKMVGGLREQLEYESYECDPELRSRALTCLTDVDTKIEQATPVDALRMWAAAVRILKPRD